MNHGMGNQGELRSGGLQCRICGRPAPVHHHLLVRKTAVEA